MAIWLTKEKENFAYMSGAGLVMLRLGLERNHSRVAVFWLLQNWDRIPQVVTKQNIDPIIASLKLLGVQYIVSKIMDSLQQRVATKVCTFQTTSGTFGKTDKQQRGPTTSCIH